MKPTALQVADLQLAGGVCAQQATLDDGLLLSLDFDELVDGGFACGATDAVCAVKGDARVQDGAVNINQFTVLSVPELDADSAVERLTLSAWVAPSERPSGYRTILYKGKRQGEDVQQIHFFLSLFDGKPEFKFKNEAGEWKGIMRNADSFSIPGGVGLLPVWSHRTR